MDEMVRMAVLVGRSAVQLMRHVAATSEFCRQQSCDPDQVVGGGDHVASQLCPRQVTKACPTKATHRLDPAKDLLNGLFTNDKFCWSRPARLHLKWWHRAYRDR